MTNVSIQEELILTLLEQRFSNSTQNDSLIEEYKQLAESYVKTDQSLAVLSDYQRNCSYIFSGYFGSVFGITTRNSFIDSAFEDQIFNKIHPDDLLERHVLELRYFQFQQNLPQEERRKYSTFSYIRVRSSEGKYMYIIHRTHYMASLSNGTIWLSLCLYSPSVEQQARIGIDGRIINNETGETLPIFQYKQYDNTILGSRELEVLKQIALGKRSKEIANELYISPYTVYRHRQNIIKKLKVTNSSQAVQTALLMGLFDI
jgi:DNA-binding CsgD family transcriptional regulator